MRAASRTVRSSLLVAAALACGTLAACDTTGDFRSGAREVGSSLSDSFGRNTDQNGTQRRMDVNGMVTRPNLPSITNR